MAFSTSALVLFVGLVFTYSIFKLSPLENGISKDPEIRWNWDEIDLSAESIAKRIKDHTSNFVFGTATAAHQVEGNCTNNWSAWEDIPGNIANGDKSGEACQHYKLYKEDIGLMKQLDVRSYRFSIEWSKINPKKGEFSQEVTQHYHNVIDELLRQGITPMITLHH
jgi:beta-glucosidase